MDKNDLWDLFVGKGATFADFYHGDPDGLSEWLEEDLTARVAELREVGDPDDLDLTDLEIARALMEHAQDQIESGDPLWDWSLFERGDDDDRGAWLKRFKIDLDLDAYAAGQLREVFCLACGENWPYAGSRVFDWWVCLNGCNRALLDSQTAIMGPGPVDQTG